jgi:hypothetical protein
LALVVAVVAAVVAVLLPAALVVLLLLLLPLLFLQLPARLLREAQLLRPVHKLLPLVLLQVAAVRQPEVAAVVLVQGLVASEILRSR